MGCGFDAHEQTQSNLAAHVQVETKNEIIDIEINSDNQTKISKARSAHDNREDTRTLNFKMQCVKMQYGKIENEFNKQLRICKTLMNKQSHQGARHCK